MQSQSIIQDSLSAAKSTRSGFFWLPDSGADNTIEYKLTDFYSLDSLLRPAEQIGIIDSITKAQHHVYRQSIIHVPHGGQIIEKPYRPTDNTLLSFYIITVFFVAGTFSYPNRKSFQILFESALSNNKNSDLFRDRTHFTGIFFTAPFMLAIILTGIFFSYTIRQNFSVPLPDGTDAIILTAVFSLLILLKNSILKSVGKVFDTETKTEEHILYNQQIFCISALIYIPALAIALALPVENVVFFHTIIIFNVLLSIIYTPFRLFVNFSYKGLNSIMLFITYICSTEVFPVLLIIKAVYNT